MLNTNYDSWKLATPSEYSEDQYPEDADTIVDDDAHIWNEFCLMWKSVAWFRVSPFKYRG